MEAFNWNITWCDETAEPVYGSCPACGVVGARQPVLTVPNPYIAGDIVQFARCGSCKSLIAAAERLIEYTDEDGLDSSWLLSSMIRHSP